MEMTTLGKTGLRVSRLGAGLVEIGSFSIDEPRRAGRILGAALDAGINFLDTAECYANSEELIGLTVGHRRDEFVLATKAGHVSTGSSGQPWTGKTVRRGIDLSLKKLRTDRVDLVQVHAYDISAPTPDDVIEAVMDAKEAGKTRFVGYSGENEEAEWAIESGLFDTLQIAFNLVDQGPRYSIFERARERGMGLIAKRPIANAAWGKAVSPGDAGLSGTNLERLKRARALLEPGPIAEAPKDPIALALGFVLAHEDMHTAIVGTRDPEHMLANIDAVETQLPLADETVADLHERYDRIGREWRGID